jgi:hypothetical protein
VFVILLTYQIIEDVNNFTFVLILFIYSILFTIYEFPEFLILGWNYFNDTWNIIDVLKVTFTNLYLVIELFDSVDVSYPIERLILSLAVFLSWIRLIGFLRMINRTRRLIRLVIEIVKDMIPFLLIFLLFNLALTISLVALREDPFFNQWQLAYRLSFGDF